MYQTLDSLYNVLLTNSEKRAEIGDVSRLEVLNIKAKKSQVSIQFNTIEVDILNAYKRLKVLMNYESNFTVPIVFELLPEISAVPDSLPIYDLLKNENMYFNSLVRVEKEKMLPDFSASYFLGSNRYANGKYYHGFQFGVAVPLFFGSYKAKINAAKLSANAQNLFNENEINMIYNQLSKLFSEHLKYIMLLKNYNLSGEPLVNEIMKAALKSYKIGEINFYQFVNSYETAIQIQFEHLNNVLKYNQTVSEIMYFSK
jgi:cobalt-zinc-cadmium resistance protein CzcA